MNVYFSPCEDPLLLPLLPGLLQRDKHLIHGLHGFYSTQVVRVDPLDLLSGLVFVGDPSLLHPAGGGHSLQGGPVLQNKQT